MYTYRVEAGSNGTQYVGNDVREALQVYRDTLEASRFSIGKLTGAPVVLFCDDAILYRHTGDFEDNYNAILEKQPWARL